MIERLRRAGSVRRAGALAEAVAPVEIPSVPPAPGSGAAARLAAADRELTEMVLRLHGVFDAATAAGFDMLIDSWGAGWDAADDQELAAHQSLLRQRAAQVEALLAAAELIHRRCERGWTHADRDYLAARDRLGAPDPPAPRPVGIADEAASLPLGRFEPPRSTA